VQCDGYAAYKEVARRGRAGNAMILAFCWSHWRRRFYEIAKAGSAPIAEEVLRRIAELYKIEAQIRGRSAAERRSVRQAESKPLVADLKAWLQVQLARASAKSAIAVAIRYGLNHWEGLERFLEDGRIEIDTNVVERSMRPIECTLCRPRCRSRELGLSGFTDRNLQAERRRSTGLSDRRLDQAR
jgi:transposase